MPSDPRASVYYARMNTLITRIQAKGPMTIDQICRHLRISEQQWKSLRYGMPGRLALEDAGVSMPRPVYSENYVYKITSNYRTGDIEEDGEPNFTEALSDLMTRQATVYQLVDTLAGLATPRSKVQKLLRKTRRDMGGVLDRLEDVVDEAQAPVTEWARHVLNTLP
jgi:hypothetical protein